MFIYFAKYLDTVGCPKGVREHTTPLPLDFVPGKDDCSPTEEVALELAAEFNIDLASCVGALIYLGMTRVDIAHGVNKLAKFTRLSGRAHFNAMVHLLRYLRDHSHLGITFYRDFKRSPVCKLLVENNIKCDDVFFSFLDSSWNDNVDIGRSTGMYLVFYMGGLIDHISNMPDPVALSSAEAE